MVIDWLFENLELFWETENWDGLSLALIFGLFVIIWVIFIIWVAKDASKRSNSLMFVVIAVLMATVLTPVLWVPLYLAIRPVNYKNDNIPRRESLASSNIECFNCGVINPNSHGYCANCGTNLKITCKECKKKYFVAYKYCNECGAPNIE